MTLVYQILQFRNMLHGRTVLHACSTFIWLPEGETIERRKLTRLVLVDRVRISICSNAVVAVRQQERSTRKVVQN